MAHELWRHGMAGICREVQQTAQVEIENGTVGELISEYLTAEGWRNVILGQDSVNGRFQFLGITEV